MNKLINIEGIDGSGKTTIVNRLEEMGFSIFKEIPKTIECITIEDISKLPLHERIGYDIRLALQNGRDCDSFREMLALKYVELRRAYQPIIEDMLKSNDVVIDRGMLSTMVYGHSLNDEFNVQLEEDNLETKLPDITLYLDINIETALSRLNNRNDKRNEAYKNKSVMVKNLKTYNLLIHKYKDILNIHRVNANLDIEDVFTEVINKLGD